MADNNSGGFFKPWKDGPLENLTKACGIAMMFLFLSGIFGADYNKIATNPYVWGLYLNGLFNR